MNLLEELLDAKLEFLQEQWDEYLVQAWKDNPHVTMGRFMVEFCDKFKISYDELKTLKRVPKYSRHIHCRVSRYIAAYLPALNTCLWNNNKSFEELVKLCSKLNLLLRPADNEKAQQESRERRQNRKQAQKTFMEEIASYELRLRSRRSNWGAAKK